MLYIHRNPYTTIYTHSHPIHDLKQKNQNMEHIFRFLTKEKACKIEPNE